MEDHLHIRNECGQKTNPCGKLRDNSYYRYGNLFDRQTDDVFYNTDMQAKGNFELF